jgi:hypothetical protein
MRVTRPNADVPYLALIVSRKRQSVEAFRRRESG